MSFGFKSLGVRSISAVFFVVLLLGSVCWNYISFTVFFLLVSLMALTEFFHLSRQIGVIPYRMAGYICAVALYLLFVQTGVTADPVSYAVFLLPVIVFGTALFGRNDQPFTAVLFTLGGLLYCVAPFALLHLIVFRFTGDGVTYDPRLLLGVIFLIWSSDTFAYLTGRLVGRTKLAVHISPGKTWEGTTGGLIATVVVSLLIKEYLYSPPGNYWILLGFTVPVVATLGDLFESLLKRRAGVKDSGSIMPGHGGILDRFDSLLFVAPFVVAILDLLELH